MKKLFILIVILAAIFVAVKLSIKSPDQAIPSATEQASGTSELADDSVDTPDQTPGEDRIAANRVTVEYTGYGPGGKVETGFVQASESSLVRTGELFKGAMTFDMSTITSVPIKDKLITHLKSDDFFDVAKYPTATFMITNATDIQVKGSLTMKGITKAITLPITKSGATYTSTVRVNMEDFGIKQVFTDKEFVLKITVK